MNREQDRLNASHRRILDAYDRTLLAMAADIARGSSCEPKDLYYQAARIRVWQVADKYDPSTGKTFEAFIFWYAHGAMLNLRFHGRVSDARISSMIAGASGKLDTLSAGEILLEDAKAHLARHDQARYAAIGAAASELARSESDSLTPEQLFRRERQRAGAFGPGWSDRLPGPEEA